MNKLACAVTKCTRACDQRLALLISYIHHTCECKQYCQVGNAAQQCRLGLFQDSDFAGVLEDSKSTSGGPLCIFGSHTFVPIRCQLSRKGHHRRGRGELPHRGGDRRARKRCFVASTSIQDTTSTAAVFTETTGACSRHKCRPTSFQTATSTQSPPKFFTDVNIHASRQQHQCCRCPNGERVSRSTCSMVPIGNIVSSFPAALCVSGCWPIWTFGGCLPRA